MRSRLSLPDGQHFGLLSYEPPEQSSQRCGNSLKKFRIRLAGEKSNSFPAGQEVAILGKLCFTFLSMKVIVLGGSGLVGSHLVACLRQRGHSVSGTCWKQVVLGMTRLSMSDLRGLSLILQREKFDVLVICSGFTWVDGCENKPARARLHNAILPGKIAQLCRRHKTKVVYLSSSYVFDGERGPYSERDRPNPLSIYGKSKLEGEQMVRREGGKGALVIRTMGVVGYEPREKNFLYTVIRNLQKTKVLVVPDDQRGNLTCATDLAQGICLLLEKNKRGIYHIAGRRPNAKRSEVAKQIAKNYRLDAKLIHPKPTVELTSKAPRPRYGGLLTEKARKQVGWRPLNLLPELAKIACA